MYLNIFISKTISIKLNFDNSGPDHLFSRHFCSEDFGIRNWSQFWLWLSGLGVIDGGRLSKRTGSIWSPHPHQEKQQGRAGRNYARCAIIIVFAKEVCFIYFITFNTLKKYGKNLVLFLGSLGVLKIYMNSLVILKKNFVISIYIWKGNLTNK